LHLVVPGHGGPGRRRQALPPVASPTAGPRGRRRHATPAA